MAVHVVIPARMASTRLPGKPLADIAGKPMIVRVVEQVSQAEVDSVTAAVDDQQVHDVVQAAGYRAVMTRIDHVSGSDRVMEVAQQQQWDDHDVVINVQGDEPLIPPALIHRLAKLMRTNDDIDMATISEPIHTREDFLNPNIVKLVIDQHQQALYFSRNPIPYPRDAISDSDLDDPTVKRLAPLRHVGIYAFRLSALRKFVTLLDSNLERIESLEQLRWLEAGHSIHVLHSSDSIPGGVDTAEDLARVNAYLRSQPV